LRSSSSIRVFFNIIQRSVRENIILSGLFQPEKQRVAAMGDNNLIWKTPGKESVEVEVVIHIAGDIAPVERRRIVNARNASGRSGRALSAESPPDRICQARRTGVYSRRDRNDIGFIDPILKRKG
jgi:hypothetical protein